MPSTMCASVTASKHDSVRYFDIYEGDNLDEGQLASWIEQARKLLGERM